MLTIGRLTVLLFLPAPPIPSPLFCASVPVCDTPPPHTTSPPFTFCCSLFNDHELELLICGLPEIDVDDLRANTEYTGGWLAGVLHEGCG